MGQLTKDKEPLFSYNKLMNVFASSPQNVGFIDDLKCNLIPVMNSACELKQFIEEHADYLIVPFLLYKENIYDALLSTSSMHMNWLWSNLLYVPVNIKNNDQDELLRVYETAASFGNVVFLNHTIPHKSNPVMRGLFGDVRGDYLARSGETFHIADGNGKAFVQMARELAGGELDFAEVAVVIVGVGGAGELSARAIIREQPKRLILVDIKDKSILGKELGAEYYLGIDNIPDLSGEPLVIIDSTAHFEDGVQRCVALELVEKYDAIDNVFIDYNMNTEIGAYRHLKSRTGVGKEYVVITNYVMVLEIINAAKSVGFELPFITKDVFAHKVAESVRMQTVIKNLLKNISV